MKRTMPWKEYREHRVIWLTMMVVNSGALLGLSRLDEIFGSGGGSKLLVLGPLAALLVWAYGMICGAMLLAGEREEGTLNFLDTLPASRLHLWLLKVQTGLFLLGGQMVVMYGCLAGLRAAEDPSRLNGVDFSPPLWPYLLGMLLFGMVGMAYGLFFSARGENVLHTIGLAILGHILAGVAATFLAFAVEIIWLIGVHWFSERPSGGSLFEQPYLAFVAFFGLTIAAVVGSARRFSEVDRLRLPASAVRMRSRASVVASWLRLLWLCDRQMRRMALAVLALSLGLGVLFLVAGPLTWPLVTLFLGVLCGATVFSDEQASGSFRFLGDQRLPLGRVWLIKTGMRFALLLFASFLVLVPSLLVAVYHSAEQPNRDWELPVVIETLHLNLIVAVVPLPPYLLLWLLYGFSAGLLCGLLSRKSIVAAMIALMLSAGLAVVWVPSLAGIGLHFWQIAGPPLIFLFTAALLMRAWAANRLASWRTYLGVSAASAAALLWMAFGVWYRVIEVPDVPEPFDVAAYKASLLFLEENQAGQRIRGAWGRVDTVLQDMSSQKTKKPLIQQCFVVLNDGWPDGPSELGEWLDKTFADNWLQPLALLPDLPLGMVVDPRLLTEGSSELNKWSAANLLSDLLAARGLQQQARGDPEVFVGHMRIALALSRNLQHNSPSSGPLWKGREVARSWPAAVDTWLKKLHGRSDLLQRALQVLMDHEAQLPDSDEPFQADYLLSRNTLLNTPQQLLKDAVPSRSKESDDSREAELQIATVLWMIPWEQERHLRLLRVQFGGNEIELRKSREWDGRVFASLGFSRRFRERSFPRQLVNLRACQLKVALRLYQEENGELPAALAALVPRYVKAIPRDPFGDGQPFRYRQSRGEWIIWPEFTPPHEVPVMPPADEPAAPAAPPMQVPPRVAGAVPMPPGAGMAAGGMAGMVDEGPPGGVPFMPHADEPVGPLPPQRWLRGNRGGMPPGGPPPSRGIPKGQAILWSVGEDRHDDGGKQQGLHASSTTSFGEDLIYLVPLPPR
ncbi:MAG TPA: ABC transporter permease [Gemmataceae bacterium]|nr:ABC transporter permease [Gemmataceae bacterium]